MHIGYTLYGVHTHVNICLKHCTNYAMHWTILWANTSDTVCIGCLIKIEFAAFQNFGLSQNKVQFEMIDKPQ